MAPLRNFFIANPNTTANTTALSGKPTCRRNAVGATTTELESTGTDVNLARTASTSTVPAIRKKKNTPVPATPTSALFNTAFTGPL